MSNEPTLTDYFGKIWIKCPKCFEKALISCVPGKGRGLLNHRIRPLDWSSPTLDCKNCGYHLTKSSADWGNHEKWFGPWVGRVETSCQRCGNRISHRTQLSLDKTSTIDLTCESCHLAGTFDLEWTEASRDEIDPYFGLEFFYNKSIKGNILWVLNEEHCDSLISYISSNQRAYPERAKWSMVSNLPKWMILAKNRDTLLKVLLKFKKEMNAETG